jgi:hypothetical protein
MVYFYYRINKFLTGSDNFDSYLIPYLIPYRIVNSNSNSNSNLNFIDRSTKHSIEFNQTPFNYNYFNLEGATSAGRFGYEVDRSHGQGGGRYI